MGASLVRMEIRAGLSLVVTTFLALFTLGCDQSTKLVASSILRESPLSLPWGVVLTYAENRDMAFGLLASVFSEEHRLWLLSFGKAAAVAGALLWLIVRRAKGTRVELVGVALVLSGALGNLIDRLRFGYVVDFLKVPYWPVFNVADVAIVVGMGLLVLAHHRANEQVRLA